MSFWEKYLITVILLLFAVVAGFASYWPAVNSPNLEVSVTPAASQAEVKEESAKEIYNLPILRLNFYTGEITPLETGLIGQFIPILLNPPIAGSLLPWRKGKAPGLGKRVPLGDDAAIVEENETLVYNAGTYGNFNFSLIMQYKAGGEEIILSAEAQKKAPKKGAGKFINSALASNPELDAAIEEYCDWVDLQIFEEERRQAQVSLKNHIDEMVRRSGECSESSGVPPPPQTNWWDPFVPWWDFSDGSYFALTPYYFPGGSSDEPGDFSILAVHGVWKF